jgi:hypothetical protein
VSEAISPTLRLTNSAKGVFQDVADFVIHSRREQVEIAAGVGPVVQRFHYRYRQTAAFKCADNLLQCRQYDLDAGSFGRQPGVQQLRKIFTTTRKITLQYFQESSKNPLGFRLLQQSFELMERQLTDGINVTFEAPTAFPVA